MKYESLAEIVEIAEKEKTSISDFVIKEQAEARGESEKEILEQMLHALHVMKESSEEGIDKDKRSASGLTGGSAYKMKKYVETGNTICGETFGMALTRALAVSETNACMGKIVASPTAGSCGIVPAALITVMEDKGISEDKIVKGLFTASAIGMVIAKKASIAGAEGGCQAECGSASAMAAGALVEIFGGTPKMVANACAISLKNVLGLVCDPVAGLVEIPCIKRNAAGVANAFMAAELALAHIESAIPIDEVIWAMKKIGDDMSSSLKETAEGGLAATPTGQELRKKVFG